MPLKDHFHAPLYPTRAWESFHSRWANSMADALQKTLPPRYVAEVQIHLGSSVEADVAEFELTGEEEDSRNGAGGGPGVAVRSWAPPAPPVVMPGSFPDDLEVEVRDLRDDARLVGIVELLSPRNKDRADSRRTFAAKCVAYLQRGIGVVVADIVTSRQFNLHNDMIRMLNLDDAFLMPEEAFLYTVAYRPARREDTNLIDVWPTPLTLGLALPVVPLALRGYRAIPLDLEATYTDACQRSRL